MNVYIYDADIYCEECGEAIRQGLISGGFGLDDDGYCIADAYPKGPYPDGGGEADRPQHCRAGGNCLNALELSDGCKVGAWLKNELTANGVEYVKEAIQGGGVIAKLWAKFYVDYDLDPCSAEK